MGGRAIVPRLPGLRADRVPHQQLDDGGRFSAAAPDRRGRQLYRPRVRADVPALRQRGHDSRDGRRGWFRAKTRTFPRRSRRFWSGKGSRSALNAKCIGFSRRGEEMIARARMHRRRAGGRRLARAAGGGAASEHRRSRPGKGRRRGRRTRLHRGGRSTAHQRAGHLGAGRLQRQGRVHAHLLQRLRNRGGEPAGQRSAPRQRPHHGICAVHRSAAGPRRHDGGARCARAAARR